MRLAAALAFLLTSNSAFSQTGVLKDQFLQDFPAGTLAIAVSSDVNKIQDSRRVIPLEPKLSQSVGRRRTCIVAMAHHEPELAGKDTFVGIQVIKMFTAHTSPGVVFVGRNPGWLPSRGTAQLAELKMSEVYKASLSDFAGAHTSEKNLEALAISKGRLAASWHARLEPNDPDVDSVSEPNLRFWAENPMSDQAFTSVHAETLKTAPYVRIENHLIRFTLTGDTDPKSIPSVEFDCRDSRLSAVAIRAYLPFSSSYASWGHLAFK